MFFTSPHFLSQLLSVGKVTNSLKCLAIFSPHNVIFQDLATKKTIGEGFFLNGLYYIPKDTQVPKVFQVNSSLAQEQQLWHQRLTHPSGRVLSALFPSLCKITNPLMFVTCLSSLDYHLLPLCQELVILLKSYIPIFGDPFWNPFMDTNIL